MKPRAPLLLLVVAALLLPGALALAAADTAADFDAANKLFEQGKFSEAVAAYEKIIQSGKVSAGLYFNRGNALFKSGQVGRAVASYRRALELEPRDPDARANLQFVRSQIQGPTQPPGRAQRWLGTLSLNEWSVLTSVALWIWLLILAGRQWQPELKRRLRGLAWAAGTATVILGLSLAAMLALDSAPTAVVIVPDAAVRTGPLEDSRAAFTVHDGAELAVLDQKDNWLQVSAGGQWVGWLKRDQALRSPPR